MKKKITALLFTILVMVSASSCRPYTKEEKAINMKLKEETVGYYVIGDSFFGGAVFVKWKWDCSSEVSVNGQIHVTCVNKINGDTYEEITLQYQDVSSSNWGE